MTTNRSLEKRLESFDLFDSFELFDPKHNFAKFNRNIFRLFGFEKEIEL